ncbi:hypothetical protein OCH239_15215 [Roseivivax halodurans JCM 10272]|uniref:Uncharacterized protein n=1 Tax=Roseivivax halodurans JCM 10272 TaxID=1449350 RepID=X7EAI8_9RHOB|nr:hypothetical protein [Roseivivax halodurans]ETX12927.1 hypothetical protein OCH239_15215 [Roseivivax halodurans JCM 10272]
MITIGHALLSPPTSVGRALVSIVLTAGFYVLAHAVTAGVVTPLQSYIFPEATVFASLLYLPHGVRVVSAWLFRWTALPGLILGAALSEWLFTDPATLQNLIPVIILSILIGAISAPLVFESLRQLGAPAYAKPGSPIDWRALYTVGIVSSLLNSVGQMFVFDSMVSPAGAMLILSIYTIGDIFGFLAVKNILLWIHKLVSR